MEGAQQVTILVIAACHRSHDEVLNVVGKELQVGSAGEGITQVIITRHGQVRTCTIGADLKTLRHREGCLDSTNILIIVSLHIDALVVSTQLSLRYLEVVDVPIVLGTYGTYHQQGCKCK